MSGALIQAHANRTIREGTRVSIAFGAEHGLVTVSRIEGAPKPEMSYYGVQVLWLDRDLEAGFADTVSMALSCDLVPTM